MKKIISKVGFRRFFVIFGLLVLSFNMTVSAALKGVVAGKILNQDAEKMKGVVVTLNSVGGKNPNRTTKSSKSGSYRFTNVNPGSYIIIAALDGYTHKNTQLIRVNSNGKIKLPLFMDLNTDKEEPAEQSIEKTEMLQSPSRAKPLKPNEAAKPIHDKIPAPESLGGPNSH